MSELSMDNVNHLPDEDVFEGYWAMRTIYAERLLDPEIGAMPGAYEAIARVQHALRRELRKRALGR